MRRSEGVSGDRGQSEVLGFVLLIGIVGMGCVAVLLAAGATTDGIQSQAKIDCVEGAFAQLSIDCDRLLDDRYRRQDGVLRRRSEGTVRRSMAGTCPSSSNGRGKSQTRAWVRSSTHQRRRLGRHRRPRHQRNGDLRGRRQFRPQLPDGQLDGHLEGVETDEETVYIHVRSHEIILE